MFRKFISVANIARCMSNYTGQIRFQRYVFESVAKKSIVLRKKDEAAGWREMEFQCPLFHHRFEVAEQANRRSCRKRLERMRFRFLCNCTWLDVLMQQEMLSFSRI